jgi:hypothetical protein
MNSTSGVDEQTQQLKFKDDVTSQEAQGTETDVANDSDLKVDTKDTRNNSTVVVVVIDDVEDSEDSVANNVTVFENIDLGITT